MKIIIELKEKERFGFLNLKEHNRIEEHAILKEESWAIDDNTLRIMKRVTGFSKNRVVRITYPLISIVKFTVEE